jgi:hypothetical protein
VWIQINPRSFESVSALKGQNLIVPAHRDGNAVQTFEQHFLISG